MRERRSVQLPAPDRWLRLHTEPSASGWNALRNGERLGWLEPDPHATIVRLRCDGVLLGHLADELGSYYHPALRGLAVAGIDVWTRVNVVAVEDRYVLHDYLREEPLLRWTQQQLRS
ncbi:hypothetical protein HQQ80_18380 [Microbacteriaceae bacterium VKM Ac-2855]|nr:hypothetical protein [Microbacteriaceae bacterium VKM Ac-2855]